tara:strand:- start:3544 stop:4101 length:558 start_codon:yes stop_codon:yes gene_type:complete
MKKRTERVVLAGLIITMAIFLWATSGACYDIGYQGCCGDEDGVDFTNGWCHPDTFGVPCVSGVFTDGINCNCEGDSDVDRWLSFEYGGHDCDDGNKRTYPGAYEDCQDGYDNDCDGYLDAEDPGWDNDNDGYTHEECADLAEDDCDDDDAGVYPGAPEIPDNEVDDDCDGEIDEVEEGCFIVSIL